MNGIEFYIFEDEIWYRTEDGKNEKLTESSREVIKEVLECIQEFYPKAYSVLSEFYGKSRTNIIYWQYVIVRRFCKCNFGNIDNVPDLDSQHRFHFERVACPLRGECPLENVVCNPVFNSKISDAEMRVLEKVFNGYSNKAIADSLFLSIHTVHNHIRNAYTRLGIREKAEFIDYAHRNNLFKE